MLAKRARHDFPPPPALLVPDYTTTRGIAFRTNAEDFLRSETAEKYRGKVRLVFTSPPFPLNRKKAYGNETGADYVKWLASFAPLLVDMLKPDGSIVLEMGNAWEQGEPVMSTLALEALLAFLKRGRLHLCEQFVGYNRTRLPSPAPWVTVQRIRVKDAFTHLWWMAPTPRPKASNERVLTAYSPSMLRLHQRGAYNSGTRPSQHHISPTSFLTRHKGAIPSNVIEYSNTRANDAYQEYCRERHLTPHPARMPRELAEFFIKMLSTAGEYILDPFAGSNTTGAVAERLGRRWIAVEPTEEYLDGSRGRFKKTRSGPRRRVPLSRRI